MLTKERVFNILSLSVGMELTGPSILSAAQRSFDDGLSRHLRAPLRPKYMPHQGAREKARRVAQMAKAQA